jgi:hypothetical protein
MVLPAVNGKRTGGNGDSEFTDTRIGKAQTELKAFRRFAMLSRLAVVFLLISFCCSAQDLQVSDTATFTPAYGQSGELTFSTSFLFNPSTDAIIPGTMTVSESDPFGLGPFAAAYYDTNFANGSFLNYLGSNDTVIQVSLSEFPPVLGQTPVFPSPGNYGSNNTVLLCNPNGQTTCSEEFGGTYITGSGSLLIGQAPPPPAETPEPSMWILLLSGALLFALIEAWRRR